MTEQSDSLEAALSVLIQRAFEARDAALASRSEVVVDPAVPILWFGDLDAYLRSSLRVVTAALNPSHAEFPASDPFSRFPACAHMRGPLTVGDLMKYRQALSGYFSTGADPYRSWFASLEPLLNGMDASFYDGSANRVLHTDMCTPVATDPTWNGLPRPAQRDLIAVGRPLWRDLLAALRPHVILVSVATAHRDDTGFLSEGGWSTVATIERANPYRVEALRVRTSPDHWSLMVFGRAAQKPFSLISNADKRRVGAMIAEAVHG